MPEVRNAITFLCDDALTNGKAAEVCKLFQHTSLTHKVIDSILRHSFRERLQVFIILLKLLTKVPQFDFEAGLFTLERTKLRREEVVH